MRYRQFFRYPTDIPIEITVPEKQLSKRKQLHNVSLGGISFKASCCWEQGTILNVRIPFVKPPFEATGKVVWCQQQTNCFYVGVEFLQAEDGFRVRMVEQICLIEQYRHQQTAQGRKLSSEEAALEWINRSAADYPPLDDFTKGVGRD
ncbi:MAG: PilZ domain-containing protein [Thiotrichaceae bacterium]